MPNLRNGTKVGFEPGLTLLRVQHSTAELPRSIIYHISIFLSVCTWCFHEIMLRTNETLKRGYIEFKYYSDAIHSGLTPPG